MQSSLIEVNFIGGLRQGELERASRPSRFFFFVLLLHGDMSNLLLGTARVRSRAHGAARFELSSVTRARNNFFPKINYDRLI